MFLDLTRLKHLVRVLDKTRLPTHSLNLLFREDRMPQSILLSKLHHRATDTFTSPASQVVEEPAWLAGDLIGILGGLTKIGGGLARGVKNTPVLSRKIRAF